MACGGCGRKASKMRNVTKSVNRTVTTVTKRTVKKRGKRIIVKVPK